MPENETNFRGNELKKNRIYEGLTASQWRYCEERAAGAGPSEAYRRAYPNNKGAPSTIGQNASELERDARIQEKTRQMINERKPQTTLVPTITRELVTAGIHGIATEKLAPTNVRLRAYELLGKIAGVDLFRDVKVIETRHRSIDDVDAELKAYLAKLKPMIEADSRANNARQVNGAGEMPGGQSSAQRESREINSDPVNNSDVNQDPVNADSVEAEGGAPEAEAGQPEAEAGQLPPVNKPKRLAGSPADRRRKPRG